MTDMNTVIVPKSDQWNADDFIGGPRTFTITDVSISPGADQPVAIKFENGEGKVWRPCKSMSRVLVHGWKADARAYVGRSVTLYRDPNVKWGGMAVGGIRISHMTDIERAMNVALTETKGKRAPFTVKPMPAPSSRPTENTRTAPPLTLQERADKLEGALNAAPDLERLTSIWQSASALRADLANSERLILDRLTRAWKARDTELDAALSDDDDTFPGDQP